MKADPDVIAVTAKPFPEPERVAELLYRCIVELEYVQSIENCHSGLCASAEGKHLIDLGMKELGVKELSSETLRDLRRKSKPAMTAKPPLYTDLLSVVDSILAEAGDECDGVPIIDWRTLQGWIDRLRGIRAALEAKE